MISLVENLGKTLCTDSSDWVTLPLFSFLGAAATEAGSDVSFPVYHCARGHTAVSGHREVVVVWSVRSWALEPDIWLNNFTSS